MAPSERVSVPERVEHLFYSHGLLCSSHPFVVLSIAVTVILLCCYPLLYLPLPGDVPHTTLTEAYNFTITENSTVFSGPPSLYIQQIVFKTGVSPWTKDLVLFDAFRAPLAQVFNLVQIVNNYQHTKNGQTLGNVCLHVESVKLPSDEKWKILPEYNCLLVSPANFWQQDIQIFQQDIKLLNTIFSYHNFQKGKISISEILFGVNMKETGMKRYPLRSRPRTVQFAITLVLEKFDDEYVTGLREKLESIFPLHKNESKNYQKSNEILHIYYPGEFNIHEFLPLTLTYTVLFLYIYFSVRKIEFIKSKPGIAFSAVVTIICSLCMSIGLCFFFGLTFSLSGKEIFPYSVIIVGLENVLVITKSVTNVAPHLDVKIRVAQGLSKEGWSITKNLLTEVTILTIGIFTFVPVLQQICIFGIVGIVCDFFLQMFFFTAILSVDIKRMDKLDNYSNEMQQKNFLHIYDRNVFNRSGKGIMRSKSHHNLTCTSNFTNTNNTAYPANILAPTQPILNKLPKRLRLVNFWASTRFLQRALMIGLVAWMCFILYSAGFVQEMVGTDQIAKFHEKLQDSKTPNNPLSLDNMKDLSDLIRDDVTAQNNGKNIEHFEAEDTHTITENIGKFRHSDHDPHRRLSLYHWPALLSLYNISLANKYISVLPAIRLSHVINPTTAIEMRNPDDKMEHFHWKNLAVALDPLDFAGSDGNTKPGLLPNYEAADRPIIPSSPMEIALVSILVLVSVLVLGYTTMMLYKCICTRNYAEWRSSWEEEALQDSGTQVVLEAVSMTLDGHTQEIECLSTDGCTIASSCLGGHIRVWNGTCGELITTIDRRKYFGYLNKKNSIIGLSDCELNHSDYESGSPPSRGEQESENYKATRRKISQDYNYFNLLPVFEERPNIVNRKQLTSFPDYKPHINFNFSNFKHKNQIINVEKGFDFGSQYKKRSSIEVDDEEEDYKQSDKQLHELRTESVDVNSECCSPELCVFPVWCIDCFESMVVVGCSNGRLEFWDGSTGQLRCVFEDGTNVGITSVKLVDTKVVTARLNGSIDLLRLESRQTDWGFSSFRRTHVRTGSAGSALDIENRIDEVRCMKVSSVRAHQQPISVLEVENGRIVSGSQDHTLKVLRLDDQSLLYTLHGHCGPITCMFIDRLTPFLSGSGSQDGLLCVWDLLTGACMYSIQAHDGAVTALTYSPSYVISLGADDKLCVWERFLGHLLNTIQVSHTYCSSMVMLTHNLLITSKQGSLVLWDVRSGEPVRYVRLGNSDHSVFVKQILHVNENIVCDYGNQLRVIQFPIISDKTK